MRRVLLQALAWTAAAILGSALGVASALISVERDAAAATDYGDWRASDIVGAPAGNLAARAAAARAEPLALSAREGLAFTLDRDAEGARLDESCIYELAGGPIPARWWSVTLYGRDDLLVDNGDNAHAVNSERIAQDYAGRWRARIAPVRGEAADWLSSRAAGRGFSLTLRAYHPTESRARLGAALPALSAVRCAGEIS